MFLVQKCGVDKQSLQIQLICQLFGFWVCSGLEIEEHFRKYKEYWFLVAVVLLEPEI